jgi:hypothetical protein
MTLLSAGPASFSACSPLLPLCHCNYSAAESRQVLVDTMMRLGSTGRLSAKTLDLTNCMIAKATDQL